MKEDQPQPVTNEQGIEFAKWPSIGRQKRNDIVITEKMDGTNACIIIEDGVVVGIQSRKRFISRHDDNFGFANWVLDNEAEIVTLGNGRHYGEWCGPGIQKNPHNLEEKTFFLFNTHRQDADTLPCGIKIVEVLYHGPHDDSVITRCYDDLYLKHEHDMTVTPEGIIVYYILFKDRVKYTYANKDGKWANGKG